MDKKKETRIKIEDLPKDMQVSEEDLKRVVGGVVGFKQPQPGEPGYPPKTFPPVLY
jgi:hypothetical protein